MSPPAPALSRALFQAAAAGRLPPTAVPDVSAVTEALRRLVREAASGEEARTALAAHLPRPPRLPTRSAPALGGALARHYYRQAKRRGSGHRQVFSDGRRHLYHNGHALVLWTPEEALPPGTYAFEALEEPECAEVLRLGEAPAGDHIAEVFARSWEGPYLKVREEAAISRSLALEQVVAVLEGPAGVWGTPLHHLTPLLAVSAIQLDAKKHWVFARRPGVALATFAFAGSEFLSLEVTVDDSARSPHPA